MPPIHPTIFISHANPDSKIASLIEQHVKQAFPGGFRIFNASSYDSLEPGSKWKDEIARAVKGSSALLVVLTINSVARPWIYFEAGGARYRDIDVIPLLGPGINKGALEVELSDFLAVDLCKHDQITRMMRKLASLKGLTDVPGGYDSASLCEALKAEFLRMAPEPTNDGKIWMTKDFQKRQISQYLAKADSSHEIRVLSYTGETTSIALPQLIVENLPESARLNIRVLLRSEFDSFPSRPEDKHSRFNLYVRWRISRAKAQWYRWIRSIDGKWNNRVQLELRDYSAEPTPKMMLLDKSLGFFGLYGVDHLKQLPDHKDLGPAMDWVAAITDMSSLHEASSLQLNNLATWFDAIWNQATRKTHEAYRYEFSEEIWGLVDTKAERDLNVRNVIKAWKVHRANQAIREVENLALPLAVPQQTSSFVDFIGAVIQHRQTKQSLLFTEVRESGDNREGHGKTATVLDFLGIEPSLSSNCQNIDLLVNEDLSPSWEEADVNAGDWGLYASDFVWGWPENGRLCVTRPIGEPIWGLWDSSRYCLRRALKDLNEWRDGFQRDEQGRQLQQKIFLNLPFKDLHKRYVNENPTFPSHIFVIRPSHGHRRIGQLKGRNRVQLLEAAMTSAVQHPSRFWSRDQNNVAKHCERVRLLISRLDHKKLPRVYQITGNEPCGSWKHLILGYI